jgi:fermentation-respiration switch protein FrsA (DUF1100 family)
MNERLKRLWEGESFAWRVARVCLMTCAGLGILTVVLVMAFEDRLIYFPAKYPEGDWQVERAPAREGEIIPRMEDCRFTTEDGVSLHGWYCTPQQSSGGRLVQVPTEMTLLWFHGNAGNITHRYEMIRTVAALPVRVFIIDYRGYGKSEGTPSEEGLYRDARAAWDYLMRSRGLPAKSIIIFGKSLGGVPAIDLASKVEPAGLIVQSSFTSASDMAAVVMPLLPRALVRTKMDSLSKISKVHCPKLFIHSPADEVVPYKLGRRLFEAAPDPKRFYEVPSASHNATYLVGGKAYLDALGDFIESCKPTKRVQ